MADSRVVTLRDAQPGQTIRFRGIGRKNRVTCVVREIVPTAYPSIVFVDGVVPRTVMGHRRNRFDRWDAVADQEAEVLEDNDHEGAP